jgi:beta-glucosidase
MLFRFFLYQLFCLFDFINGIDVRILLSKMSREAKCGQMTQFGLDLVEKEYNDPTYLNDSIDITILRLARKTYKIGSFLGVPSLNVEKSHNAIRKIQDVAFNETDFEIPILIGTNSVHASFSENSVFFPQPINMAATFNEHLVKLMAQIIGKETRATGSPWSFAPVLDIGRQPLWPRLYETFREDVYLASKMAEVFIKGHQGESFKNRRTAANCLKHFVGYSYPFNGRDRSVA